MEERLQTLYICPGAALKDGKSLRLHCRHLIRTPFAGPNAMPPARWEDALRCQIWPPVRTSPSICLDRRAALRNEEMEAASWRPASVSPAALLSVMVPSCYVRLVSPVSNQRAELRSFACMPYCHVWLRPSVTYLHASALFGTRLNGRKCSFIFIQLGGRKEDAGRAGWPTCQ